MKVQGDHQATQAWITNSILVAFALLYCLSALLANFWGDNDTWSNLLPIIHWRHSILDQHSLPLFTDLWYGGRFQWENPLWSFLYLPSTMIWLITPLDWGARIIYLGHLIFSLLAGRKLAALFLEKNFEQLSSAILLASPMLPALIAGHIEKVMSWGWILLALFFLFNEKNSSIKRGLGSGICLGIIPLTGANYYTLYAGILLVPLVFSYKDRKLLSWFLLGALIGLLHLANVWYMLGHARSQANFYIDIFSVGLLGVMLALSIGFSDPVGWETWAAIGIPMLCLFALIFVRRVLTVFRKGKKTISPRNLALLLSMIFLLLMATGIAYRENDLFDLFRVPARALGFIALTIILYIFVNLNEVKRGTALRQGTISLFIFASAVQVAAMAWLIRPTGSIHSPYEKSVQELAELLKADQAKSVWLSSKDLSQMYIHVGLTRNNLALPNVYYGDMGQTVKVVGSHCGYSFDHLLTFVPVEGPIHELNADIEWSTVKGKIPLNNLIPLEQIQLHNNVVSVYRVVCD